MVVLGLIHYIYLAIIVLIIGIIFLKRDVVIPCILGIGIIGLIETSNLLEAVQIIYRAILVSGREFIEIILIISMVNAMSKSLSDIGADELIINPLRKFMINKVVAFFVLGITVTITSWFIWPTPATVFIGAIMVPAAVKAGLPKIWAAVALSIFGKGIALSSDFFIQGAPAITAKTAGIDDTFIIIKQSIPFWIAMSVFTVGTAFFIMRRETNKVASYDENQHIQEVIIDKDPPKHNPKFIAITTPIVFLIDVIFIYIFKLKGQGATALIGGTAILILIFTSILNYGVVKSLGEVTRYIKDGFVFGIKVFAPVIVIGAFFFLGSENTAREILGPNATGILTDMAMYISSKVTLSSFSVIIIQGFVAVILGISGSAFGGLPLMGTLAHAFNTAIGTDTSKVAAFGQVLSIWIGGTAIPWSVVSVAAICDVKPFDLARKNMIPVIVGIIATLIVAFILI